MAPQSVVLPALYLVCSLCTSRYVASFETGHYEVDSAIMLIFYLTLFNIPCVGSLFAEARCLTQFTAVRVKSVNEVRVVSVNNVTTTVLSLITNDTVTTISHTKTGTVFSITIDSTSTVLTTANRRGRLLGSLWPRNLVFSREEGYLIDFDLLRSEDHFYVRGNNNVDFASYRHPGARALRGMKKTHDVHALAMIGIENFFSDDEIDSSGIMDITTVHELINFFATFGTSHQKVYHLSAKQLLVDKNIT